MKRITIPKSVKKIDVEAFSYCTDLQEIYFEGDKPDFGTASFSQGDFKPTFFGCKAAVYYNKDCSGWNDIESTWDGGGDITFSAVLPDKMEQAYTVTITVYKLSESTAAGLPLQCVGRVLTYTAVYDPNTKEFISDYVPEPGDSIVVTVTEKETGNVFQHFGKTQYFRFIRLKMEKSFLHK